MNIIDKCVEIDAMFDVAKKLIEEGNYKFAKIKLNEINEEIKKVDNDAVKFIFSIRFIRYEKLLKTNEEYANKDIMSEFKEDIEKMTNEIVNELLDSKDIPPEFEKTFRKNINDLYADI